MKSFITSMIALVVVSTTMFSQEKKYAEIETKSLDELYADAIEEGGTLIIRAGGDKADQADYYLDMFKARFPKIKVIHSVDLSKYHAPRYDNAMEKGGHENVPDIIQLQTLHDYDYYMERGLLMPYKAKNWDKIYPDYKDPHGYWTGLFGVSFSNLINIDVINKDKAPRDAMDYLDPALKGKIILTYPHDDDAVLYQFWNLKQKYGWEYLEKLVATNPTWVRGTSMPYVAVNNGWHGASFTTSWAFVPFKDSSARFMLPKEDFFLTWFQSAAIPTKAKHKAAAKLYLNWMLSKDFQEKWLQWPIRMDVETPGGYKPVHHYNTSAADFHRFMLKREMLERFRFQMEQLIGPIKGDAPLDMDYSKKPQRKE